MEYQPKPPGEAFPGVTVFYAPNDDDFETLASEQLRGAIQTARQVATAIATGGKVLVTCRMGWNRSGLVSALAIHMLTGKPGVACVREVRRLRPRSMRNPLFVRMLERLPARPQILGAF
jgi:protein-tyrosine phosphatase